MKCTDWIRQYNDINFLLQQFDGTILGPKILGDSTGLSPIWIIFAITVGGATCGVVGMFLGVPIIAVLVYLMNHIFDYMLYKKHLKTDLSNVSIPEINPDNVFIPKDFDASKANDPKAASDASDTSSSKENSH